MDDKKSGVPTPTVKFIWFILPNSGLLCPYCPYYKRFLHCALYSCPCSLPTAGKLELDSL